MRLKKETIFKKNSKACSQKRGVTVTISKENEKKPKIQNIACLKLLYKIKILKVTNGKLL